MHFPGILHKGIFCNECRTAGLMGIRWKCAVCNDYDLCNECYMDGKHDRDHKFYRYDTFASRRFFSYYLDQRKLSVKSLQCQLIAFYIIQFKLLNVSQVDCSVVINYLRSSNNKVLTSDCRKLSVRLVTRSE